MAITLVTEAIDPAELEGRHLVVNCRTLEVFACDTHEEADALAEAHNRETEALAAREEQP